MVKAIISGIQSRSLLQPASTGFVSAAHPVVENWFWGNIVGISTRRFLASFTNRNLTSFRALAALWPLSGYPREVP